MVVDRIARQHLAIEIVGIAVVVVGFVHRHVGGRGGAFVAHLGARQCRQVARVVDAAMLDAGRAEQRHQERVLARAAQSLADLDRAKSLVPMFCVIRELPQHVGRDDGADVASMRHTDLLLRLARSTG